MRVVTVQNCERVERGRDTAVENRGSGWPDAVFAKLSIEIGQATNSCRVENDLGGERDLERGQAKRQGEKSMSDVNL